MRLIVTTMLCTFLLNGCATNLAGRSQLAYMPDSEVNAMGVQAFEQLKKEKPISNNQRYQQFTQCVASPMLKQVGGDWEVVVFEDKSLNAFALPGNKIGVHTGLIELVDNQDQLASVIGHEIGHVLNKHSNERMSHQAATEQGMALIQAMTDTTSMTGQLTVGALGLGAQYGILLPYSRLHESEADIYGLDLMANAGFDPRQSVVLWQKMAQASSANVPSEFLSTHPSNQTRINDLKQQLPQAIQKQQQAIHAGQQPHCEK